MISEKRKTSLRLPGFEPRTKTNYGDLLLNTVLPHTEGCIGYYRSNFRIVGSTPFQCMDDVRIGYGARAY